MQKRLITILAAVAFTGISCTSNQSASIQAASDNVPITGSAEGTLRLSLSNGDDALAIAKRAVAGRNRPGDAVEHVWLTIKEVQLHIAGDPSENGWKTVATPNKKFDFLELVNGLTEPLDLYSLPAGHYTQIRLILGSDEENYYGTSIPANTIVINGETYPLAIPGAWKTGIKCVRSFFIEENEVTEICLAFDVVSAIHYSAGNGFMMRPAYRTFKCDGSDPEGESVSEPDGEPDEEYDEYDVIPVDELETATVVE